jgi:hypothetical protein
MITLHDIHSPLPHADVPLLTREEWELLERNGDDDVYGYLLDMWIEDETVVGLWRTADSQEPFIISLASDYTPNSQYLATDLVYTRAANEEGTGSSYYMYEYHIIERRGQNSRLIAPPVEDI